LTDRRHSTTAIGTRAGDDGIQLLREHLQPAFAVAGHALDAGHDVPRNETPTGGIQFLSPPEPVENRRRRTFH